MNFIIITFHEKKGMRIGKWNKSHSKGRTHILINMCIYIII